VTVVDVEPAAASELAGRATDVVQLVREAISNVARHAKAQTCRISLRREGDGALLEVDDDGVGFDPEAAPSGMGLANLRGRVEALGGALELESAAGQGTTVRVRIPL
jgi:two-component system sensor histidine kinase UhpB